MLKSHKWLFYSHNSCLIQNFSLPLRQRSINHINIPNYMSKVAYLLGAGASYGTRGKMPLSSQPPISSDTQFTENYLLRGLPILQEFSLAIAQLQAELIDKTFIAERKDFSSNALSSLLHISYNYPTIDTYAKLLYATRQIQKYYEFKRQLSLFFLIWQHIHKQDLRYDSFVSSLIDAKTGEMPSATILSWNYDLQLEMAYASYLTTKGTLTQIWDKLNVYSKTNNTLSEYNNDKPFACIKLNGSAIFHTSEKNIYTSRHTLKDVLWTSSSEQQFWEEIYKLYTDIEQADNPFSNPIYENELSYCWEDQRKEDLLKNVKARVEDCEVLVIIGYSFPYVNRAIDRDIFASMQRLKTIYIQDKEGVSKEIKERVENIFEYIQREKPNIVIKQDISQFYIPNELG